MKTSTTFLSILEQMERFSRKPGQRRANEGLPYIAV